MPRGFIDLCRLDCLRTGADRPLALKEASIEFRVGAGSSVTDLLEIQQRLKDAADLTWLTHAAELLRASSDNRARKTSGELMY